MSFDLDDDVPIRAAVMHSVELVGVGVVSTVSRRLTAQGLTTCGDLRRLHADGGWASLPLAAPLFGALATVLGVAELALPEEELEGSALSADTGGVEYVVAIEDYTAAADSLEIGLTQVCARASLARTIVALPSHPPSCSA